MTEAGKSRDGGHAKILSQAGWDCLGIHKLQPEPEPVVWREVEAGVET